MADRQQTKLLMDISKNIGVLTGAMTEIKEQLERQDIANDERHKKNEARVSRLEDDKKKVIWGVFGLSISGAFAGTKIGAFVNSLFGMNP